eukprot:scaffold39838_cov70-Phaeocystis_antarctica.AAC.15
MPVRCECEARGLCRGLESKTALRASGYLLHSPDASIHPRTSLSGWTHWSTAEGETLAGRYNSAPFLQAQPLHGDGGGGDGGGGGGNGGGDGSDGGGGGLVGGRSEPGGSIGGRSGSGGDSRGGGGLGGEGGGGTGGGSSGA